MNSARAATVPGRTRAVVQNLEGVQVSGATLNIAAGDVSHHTHNHFHHGGTGQTTMQLPPGWERIENQRSVHIATLGRATPGTGLWVRLMETWGIWVNPEGYIKIMWGRGMPGAGKTILASIVINILEDYFSSSDSPVCVCYIYFRYSNHAKATIRELLEILVKQTLERHPQCYPLFEELYARHIYECTQPSEEELLGLLQCFIGEMIVTFYIIDALDEAPAAIQLEILKKLSLLNAKLFITSRPLATIESHFPHAQYFSVVAQDEDLDLHISNEVSRNPDLCDILDHAQAGWRDRVVSSVKLKCGGMFLHASLQLKALRECASIHDVKETLERFPSQIEDLYIQTWSRLLDQSPGKALLAKRTMLWVLNASRALTLEELQQAIATSPDTYSIEPDRVVPEATLVGLCRGLLTVESGTRLVRLIHYTAKQPLERLVGETFPRPHTILGTVCITLLKDRGFHCTKLESKLELQEALRRDPLLAYAHHSWSIHGRQTLDDVSSIHQLADFVKGCSRLPIMLHDNWDFDVLEPLHVVAFYNLPLSLVGSEAIKTPNLPTQRTGTTPLALACLQNAETAVEQLLLLPNIGINALDGNGLLPLASASAMGYEGVVKLLLDHHQSDVNLAEEEGWTALMRACENGREGTVKLLLAHPKIDVNKVAIYGWTALIHAVAGGNEGVTQLLLSHPMIDVNLPAQKGWTPLIFAVKNGHIGTVKLILGHPQVNVNLPDEQGGTPLMHALAKDNQAMALVLIAHPKINLNMVNQEGLTALILASKYARDKVVKRILEFPHINVNQADSYRRTPLIWASREGHEGTVQLLLSHPHIDTNLVDGQLYRRTALSWASENGHEGIVKLLLAHSETNINAVDESGQTALSRASQGGREAMVTLLLAHPQIDVNVKDEEGLAALNKASKEGRGAIVKLLLSHPEIDVNTTDCYRETALSWALWWGHEGTVKHLLAHPKIRVGSADLEVAKARAADVNSYRHERYCRIVTYLETFLNDLEI